ncbi:unnamed protein product [Diatraea saccharalis]|uniref:Uncharacterized protein n=1 Tax=Diatraea saccharalis TaxID=40085 RepID=A0A9N9WKY8_9NEOP|nr:unnamed protein product [Diatraea saccharalis]
MEYLEINEARRLTTQGEYRDAFNSYLTAIEKHPTVKIYKEYEFRVVLAKLMEALFKMPRHSFEMMYCVRYALRAFPGNIVLLTDIGDIFYSYGMHAGALIHYEKALNLDSSLVNVEIKMNESKKMISDKDMDGGIGLSALMARGCKAQSTVSFNSSPALTQLVQSIVLERQDNSITLVDHPIRDFVPSALLSAWERLLARDARALPYKGEYYVAGAKCKRIANKYRLHETVKKILNIPNSKVLCMLPEQKTFYKEDLNMYDDIKIMTDEHLVFDINFDRYDDVVAKNRKSYYDINLIAKEDGEIDVTVGWFKLYLTKYIELTNDPRTATVPCESRTKGWSQAVFPDFVPTKVNINQSTPIKFVLKEGKIAFQTEFSKQRISISPIRFLNDTVFMNAIIRCVPAACAYLQQIVDITDTDIIDFSPFPMFGLQMMLRGARSLLCHAWSLEDQNFIQSVFKANDVPLDKITVLCGDCWQQEFYKDQVYHVIFSTELLVRGDIDAHMWQTIQNLRISRLAPGGLLLPTGITVILQLATSDWLDINNKLLDDNIGFKMASHVNKYRKTQALELDLSVIKYEELSNPVLLSDYCNSNRSHIVSVTPLNDAECSAILCWYKLKLFEHDAEISTKREGCFIDTFAHLLNPPVPIFKGDDLNLIVVTESNGCSKCYLHNNFQMEYLEINEARRLTAQGEYRDAFKSYLTAIEKHPTVKIYKEYEFRVVLAKLMEALFKMPRHSFEMMYCVRYALRAFPDNIVLMTDIGDIFYSYGMHAEDLIHYEKALNLDSSLVNVEIKMNESKKMIFDRGLFRLYNDKTRNAAYGSAMYMEIKPQYDRILDMDGGIGLSALIARGCKAQSTSAWERLLARDARALPHKGEYYVAGAECKRIANKYRLHETVKKILNIPNSKVLCMLPEQKTFYKEDLNMYDDIKIMTDEHLVFDINFDRYDHVVAKNRKSYYDINLIAKEDGEIDVTVGWFKLYLTKYIELTNDPRTATVPCESRTKGWSQAVFPDFVPTKVNINQSTPIKFVLKEGKIAFQTEFSKQRISISPIRFLNDTVFMNAIIRCVPAACAYLQQIVDITDTDIIDFSPFPMFGLQMMLRGARSLLCHAWSLEDQNFIQSVFKANDVPLDKITVLCGDCWQQEFYKDQVYHVIFSTELLVRGDIDAHMWQTIQNLRISRLAPGGLLLPTGITVILQLATSDWLDINNKLLDDNIGFKMASHVNKYRKTQALELDLSVIKYEELSNPVLLSDYCNSNRSHIVSVTPLNDAECSAILCWYKLKLFEHDAEISTKREGCFIDTFAHLLNPPVPIFKGDDLNLIVVTESNGCSKCYLHNNFQMEYLEINEARRLTAQGEYRDAFKSYLTAIEKHPTVKIYKEYEFRVVLAKLMEALFKMPRHSFEMMYCVRYALRAFPDNIVLMTDIGDIFYSYGMHAEDLIHYEKALNLDSSLVNVEIKMNESKKMIFDRGLFRLYNDKTRNAAYGSAMYMEIKPQYDRILDMDGGIGLSALIARGCKAQSTSAWERLLARDARALPYKGEYYVAGAECKRIANKYRLHETVKKILNIPNSKVLCMLPEQKTFYKEDLNMYDDIKIMTDEHLVFDINFDRYDHVVAKNRKSYYDINLIAKEDGEIDVTVGWFKLYLTKYIELTNDPRTATVPCESRTKGWSQAVFPDFVPTKVNINQSTPIKFVLKEGKIAFQTEFSKQRISISPIRFLNDTVFMNAIIRCVPAACAYLQQIVDMTDTDIIDFSPFPMFGLQMMLRACAYLQHIVDMTDTDIIDFSPFPMFGLQMMLRGARSLLCDAWSLEDQNFIQSAFKANDIPLDKITLLLREDIDAYMWQTIQNLRISHLAPGGLLLPTSITVTLQLATSDWLDINNKLLDDNIGFKMASHVNKYQTTQALELDLSVIKYEELSNPVLLSDYCNLNRSHIVSVTPLKDAECSAILCWYKLKLFEHDAEISTKREGCFIDSFAHLLNPPVPIFKGDDLNLIVVTE